MIHKDRILSLLHSMEDGRIERINELVPLQGGRNNTVFLYTSEAGKYCIKLYKDRNKSANEWQALDALFNRGVLFIPRPIEYIEDMDRCMVIMEYVPGEGLGSIDLDRQQLTALSLCLKELYCATPKLRSLSFGPVNCNAAKMLGRVRAFFNQPEVFVASESAGAASSLAKSWIDSEQAESLSIEPNDIVFSRGDPNLANCLWDGRHLRFIDFEYAGWSDKAFDLADLVEHIQSRNTGDASWERFIEQFGLSKPDYARFKASQKLAALFWLTKLWPVERRAESGLDDAFYRQYRRVERLLER